MKETEIGTTENFAMIRLLTPMICNAGMRYKSIYKIHSHILYTPMLSCFSRQLLCEQFNIEIVKFQNNSLKLIINCIRLLFRKIGAQLNNIKRILHLGILTAPLVITFPFWYFIEFGIRRQNVPDLWWINWMVWSIDQSGPTFTKLGQWASSRVDLFPEYVCSALSKLQSDAEPHSMKYTAQVISNTYGKPIDEMFAEFDETPVGVGAVAQVYRARLKEDGRKVAVKILHPNVRHLVHVDLQIIRGISRFIEYIIPDSHWLSLPDEVDIFSFMMRQQLDLMHEGRNLQTFRSNFQNWSSDIDFPTPLMHISTSDVLIESWIDGISMEKFLRLGPSPFDKKLATIGLTSFLKMLILDNHTHTDLHPGIYV